MAKVVAFLSDPNYLTEAEARATALKEIERRSLDAANNVSLSADVPVHAPK